MSEPRPAPPTPRGAFLRGLGLGVLAVSQPLYSLIAAQPEFFAARGGQPGEIFAVTALALLPALAWGTAAALALAFGWGESASAALAVALLAGQAGAALPWPAWAALVAVAALAASWAAPRAREFLTWAALPALLCPLLFLARAPWGTAAAPSPAPPAGGAPKTVVFVVFDEFPLATLLTGPGVIDPRWFPAFDLLSREAAWYREARSVSDDTFKAVPSLLTGTYPRPPKAPWHRDYPRNLFTLLAGTHRMHVDETHTALCPPEVCPPERPAAAARLTGLGSDLLVLYAHRTLPKTLSSRLPSVSHSWKGFLTGAEFSWDALNAAAGESYVDRAGAFRRFIGRASVPGTPALHFIHTMLPHPPWVYLPSGALAFAPNEPIVLGDGGREDRWDVDPDVAAAAWQRHVLQARFADRLLGELIEALKASGVWDEALVVVAADHGASFLPGARRRALDAATAGAVVPVPLFVKYPGTKPGGPDGRPASLVDVLPTLLAAQDIPVPEGLDGSDLRLPGRPPLFIDKDGSPRPADAGWAAARAESSRRPAALYRLGPAGRLVGRAAAGLRRSSIPPCRARLQQALSAPTPYSKAYLSGTVTCPGRSPVRRPVLAVVGGTVVASGRTDGEEGEETAPLRLMLPEESLSTGAVPELAIGWGVAGSLEFSTLTADPGAWRFADGIPVAPDGRALTLRAPSDKARAPARALKDVLELKGEARRGRDDSTPEAVLVFSGSDFVYAGVPDPESGRFDFALPRDLAGDPGRLRLFAVRGTEAWELLE